MQTHEHVLRVNAPFDCSDALKDRLLTLCDSLKASDLAYAIVFIHEELERRLDHAKRNGRKPD